MVLMSRLSQRASPIWVVRVFPYGLRARPDGTARAMPCSFALSLPSREREAVRCCIPLRMSRPQTAGRTVLAQSTGSSRALCRPHVVRAATLRRRSPRALPTSSTSAARCASMRGACPGLNTRLSDRQTLLGEAGCIRPLMHPRRLRRRCTHGFRTLIGPASGKKSNPSFVR
jgi:hypothetical protein